LFGKEIKLEFAFTRCIWDSLQKTIRMTKTFVDPLIIWNMVTKKKEYQPPKKHLFLDQKRKLELVNRIKKQIDKFELKSEDLGFTISLDISNFI
jgi:hypothetical protein